MQFEVTMRDGSSHRVEAAYLEVVQGAVSTSYTLLGPVPGYPTAIVAAFPSDLVHAITPVAAAPRASRRARVDPDIDPLADDLDPIDIAAAHDY